MYSSECPYTVYEDRFDFSQENVASIFRVAESSSRGRFNIDLTNLWSCTCDKPKALIW